MPAPEQQSGELPGAEQGCCFDGLWSDRIGHLSSALKVLIAAQSTNFMRPRRLRYIASTPRATGNTSQRSAERRPFKISNRCSSRITCSTVGSVFKTFCLGLLVQRGWHTLRMRQRGVLRAIFKGRPFPRRHQSIY